MLLLKQQRAEVPGPMERGDAGGAPRIMVALSLLRRVDAVKIDAPAITGPGWAVWRANQGCVRDGKDGPPRLRLARTIRLAPNGHIRLQAFHIPLRQSRKSQTWLRLRAGVEDAGIEKGAFGADVDLVVLMCHIRRVDENLYTFLIPDRPFPLGDGAPHVIVLAVERDVEAGIVVERPYLCSKAPWLAGNRVYQMNRLRHIPLCISC